ncbi:MAG: Ig-like domain-containing protein, partial [Clostridia bacterium]|nr:Ig-like domain-containing protein [Clostridia bacterium]
YTVENSDGKTSVGTVTVTITNVNDKPTADNKTVNLTETDSEVVAEDINLYDLVHDADIDETPAVNGEKLTIVSATVVTPDTDGAAVKYSEFIELTDDGVLKFTAPANFNGTVVVEYVVTDNGNPVETATGTIKYVVAATDDKPTADGDTLSVNEEETGKVNVLINDSDIDSDTELNLGGEVNTGVLKVTSVDKPAHGTVTFTEDGDITYTPDDNYFGTDYIYYTVENSDGKTSVGTVTVTVSNVNDAPVAEDVSVDCVEGTEPVVVELSQHVSDSDISQPVELGRDENDKITYTLGVQDPAYGYVTLDPETGKLTFTPAENFNGTYSVSYTVSDAYGETSEVKTVVFNVKAVEDDPTAVDDYVVTDEDTPIEIDVTSNDSDIDSDEKLNNTSDINDGTLKVVSVIGDAPAVMAAGFEGNYVATSHGKAVVDGNKVTYTPSRDFNGEDSFQYVIMNSDGNKATATVYITVNPVNDVPVVIDDKATTLEDESVVIDPLANDSDIDSESISIDPTGFATKVSGSKVVLNSDGTITYTPAPGFSGTDEITYVVEDSDGGKTEGKIIVTVVDSDYQISVSPSTVDFGSVDGDYANGKINQPEAQTITVTNNGNKPVHVVAPLISDYSVVGDFGKELLPGESMTFTIVPNASLNPGNYDKTLTVVTEEESFASTEVKFVVTNNYMVTATLTEGGISSIPENGVLVNGNSSYTVTITPEDGFKVKEVFVNGTSYGAVEEIILVNINESKVIQVIFEEIPKEITSNTGVTRTGEEMSNASVFGMISILIGALYISLTTLKRRKEEE